MLGEIIYCIYFINYFIVPINLLWEIQPKYYILDSLLFGDCNEYNSKDVNCCFETQCNQIFLGMVTMQYQPQYDMVNSSIK